MHLWYTKPLYWQKYGNVAFMSCLSYAEPIWSFCMYKGMLVKVKKTKGAYYTVLLNSTNISISSKQS